MKIVVTVKLVPDTNAEKRIDSGTKRLLRTGIETVLNPFDEYAIEAALQIKEKRNDGSTVTIFSMAPDSGKEIVRKALAMGADDGVMLSDAKLEGSDVRSTAFAMASALKNVGFDLILCGTQSTDAITGEVPGMLAEYLGVPGLTYVRKLEVEGTMLRAQRETETGYLDITVDGPAVVSVTKSINEPRYPSLKGIMGAKKKEIKVLSLADAGATQAVGSDGAKTEVVDVATPAVRSKGKVVTVADGAEGATVIVGFLKEKKLI